MKLLFIYRVKLIIILALREKIKTVGVAIYVYVHSMLTELPLQRVQVRVQLYISESRDFPQGTIQF